jgi:hypothetical protein
MLNWDFVKADPITYRATYGAIRFEVTVGADNRKNAVTVTRTEGDKFEIKTFRDHGKALRWCEKHPWRHESFFGLFRLWSAKHLIADTNATSRSQAFLRLLFRFQSTIFLESTSFEGERPHDSELSRDDLQATPYEINHETCFGVRFLGGTSDVNLSESEKAFPLYDAARHLTRLDFQALTAKFYKLAEAGDSKITSLWVAWTRCGNDGPCGLFGDQILKQDWNFSRRHRHAKNICALTAIHNPPSFLYSSLLDALASCKKRCRTMAECPLSVSRTSENIEWPRQIKRVLARSLNRPQREWLPCFKAGISVVKEIELTVITCAVKRFDRSKSQGAEWT